MIHIPLHWRFIFVGTLAVIGVGIGIFLLSSRFLPSPQGAQIQPAVSRASERIMIYGGTFEGQNNNILRVKLDQSKIIAGFLIDGSTKIYKLVKSERNTMQKISSTDIPKGASLTVSAIMDPKSKILIATQIVIE